MKSWHYCGQTYHWSAEGWTLHGHPVSLPHQVLLARAYLAELGARASGLGGEEMLKECRALRDLAQTDSKILEAALDYCSHFLRRNPGHRGARALHMSILSRMEQLDRPGPGWPWNN